MTVYRAFAALLLTISVTANQVASAAAPVSQATPINTNTCGAALIVNGAVVREKDTLTNELEKYLRSLGLTEYEIQKDLKWGFSPFPLITTLSKINRFVETGNPGDWTAVEIDERRATISRLPWLALNIADFSWLISAIDTVCQPGMPGMLRGLKDLMRWAPIWTNQKIAPRVWQAINQKILLFGSNDYRSAFLLLRWLMQNGPQPAVYRQTAITLIENAVHSANASLRENAAWMLTYASLLPYSELPRDFRDLLEKDWIDLGINPLLKSSKIHNFFLHSNEAGQCPDMFYGHAGQVLASHSNCQVVDGKFVPIWVGDLLVGAMKTAGDESFLAFRNVEDEQGRLILIAGGVYLVKMETLERAMAQPSGLHLETFDVEPSTFLLNSYSNDGANLINQVLGVKPEVASSQQPGDEREIWRAILHRLGKF